MTTRRMALVRVTYADLARALGLLDGLSVMDAAPPQWTRDDPAIYLKLEGDGLLLVHEGDEIPQVPLEQVIINEPLARLVLALEGKGARL